jgi:hypothetical protein
MDWAALGKKVLGCGRPVLGTALAGPAGGTVGAMIASAFGLSSDASPADVSAALDKDVALAKLQLQTVQENHRAELERLALTSETARVVAVNKTMQAEAAANDAWTRRWRPFWGYLSAVCFFIVVAPLSAALARVVWTLGTDAVAQLPAIISSLAALFAIPGAICGVTAWTRGKMQIEHVKAGGGQ